MSIPLIPGGAIAFPVNAHRHGWNGTICDQPEGWDCGRELSYREQRCAAGIDHCFHLRIFDTHAPSVMVGDGGIGWLIGDNPELLNDQILLLWAPPATEPRGKLARRTPENLIGAYRIKAVVQEGPSRSLLWRVIPYEDGWTRFGNLKVTIPRYTKFGGPYVRGVEKTQLLRSFREVADAALGNPNGWLATGDKKRFQHFQDHLEEWLDVAGQKVAKAIKDYEPAPVADTKVWSSREKDSTTLSQFPGLASTLSAVKTSEQASAAGTPSTADEDETTGERIQCIEPACFSWVRESYGERVEQMLRVAGMTKSMIVFRGNPGVGKSYLAMRLLDDPDRDRTITIPVGSTWRGREDLLGYVNPVSGKFEPTGFTKFLLRAEKAWHAGDKRPRNVVFEEFNLSQPEHWLSDVLAVSQYEEESDRFIDLGGSCVAGQPDSPETRVFLSPALSFLATINSDHTTRPLSPRVLARSALINLEMETKEVLKRVHVELEEDELEAVSALDFLLSRRGASFSLRAAKSLSRCLRSLDSLGLDRWKVIDLVLVQEVLSKVGLMAHDPNDELLISDLKKWGDEHGRKLAAASSLIAEWELALNSGHDVSQA